MDACPRYITHQNADTLGNALHSDECESLSLTKAVAAHGAVNERAKRALALSGTPFRPGPPSPGRHSGKLRWAGSPLIPQELFPKGQLFKSKLLIASKLNYSYWEGNEVPTMCTQAWGARFPGSSSREPRLPSMPRTAPRVDPDFAPPANSGSASSGAFLLPTSPAHAGPLSESAFCKSEPLHH
jgi:hypothetical protein